MDIDFGKTAHDLKTFEIAPDVYRISVFVPEINLQFNHFLIKDEEPLLFHAGLKQMFPDYWKPLENHSSITIKMDWL